MTQSHRRSHSRARTHQHNYVHTGHVHAQEHRYDQGHSSQELSSLAEYVVPDGYVLFDIIYNFSHTDI